MAQTNKGLYFKKDKKAQIYKRKEALNPDGYTICNYYPVSPSPLWCYTAQLSQAIIYLNMIYNPTETRYFVFNNYKNIEICDAIKYQNKWYRITRIDTQDDYNGELFVYVEDMEMQPITDQWLCDNKTQ